MARRFKMKNIFLLLFIMLSFSLFSEVIHVPEDQPTIQSAISEANAGDLVLVSEGVYYENIDFLGKAITVASYYYIDNDRKHIEKTIINGSNPDDPDFGSCVRFMNYEEASSILSGFTLTMGTGTYNTVMFNGLYGGGIYCLRSSPTISSNIISYNSATYAGGVGCNMDSNPRIIDKK